MESKIIYDPQGEIREVTRPFANMHGIKILCREYAYTENTHSYTLTGWKQYLCLCGKDFWTTRKHSRLRGCQECFPVVPKQRKTRYRKSAAIGSVIGKLTICDYLQPMESYYCVCDCGNELTLKCYRVDRNLVTGCGSCEPSQWNLESKITNPKFYKPVLIHLTQAELKFLKSIKASTGESVAAQCRKIISQHVRES